jgi:hypothetical protein
MAQSPAIANGMDIMHAPCLPCSTFLHNEHLLDAVQSLLGTPEITCNPIQHIRAKPPADVSGTGSNFYNVPVAPGQRRHLGRGRPFRHHHLLDAAWRGRDR